MIRDWLRGAIKQVARADCTLKFREYTRGFYLGDTLLATFLYRGDYVEVKVLGLTIYLDKEGE